MNIQFMEKTITVKHWYTGEDDVAYVPDFDKLAENASCDEELKAIREIENRFADWSSEGLNDFASFRFPIVYMIYTHALNPDTCKWEMKWQMYQHPWYTKNGVKVTKEEMIEEIKRVVDEQQ